MIDQAKRGLWRLLSGLVVNEAQSVFRLRRTGLLLIVIRVGGSVQWARVSLFVLHLLLAGILVSQPLVLSSMPLVSGIV